jgi:hypothetical protein
MITMPTHFHDFNVSKFLPSGVTSLHMVHVKKVVVVFCLAKKNVLQLSINGCMPKWTFPPFAKVSFDAIMNMRPNKSFIYKAFLVIVTISFYD